MLKWYLKSGLFTVLALVAVFTFMQSVQAFEVKVTGQVNQLIMWTDNGNASDFFIADNDNSSTRFRFTGNESFGKMDAGFKIELEAQRNATNTLDIPNTGDGDFEFAQNDPLEVDDVFDLPGGGKNHVGELHLAHAKRAAAPWSAKPS